MVSFDPFCFWFFFLDGERVGLMRFVGRHDVGSLARRSGMGVGSQAGRHSHGERG